MRARSFFILLTLLLVVPLQLLANESPATDIPYGDNPAAGHYAEVNGIKMYYEIYGSGKPMLLIHGNGQDIAAMQPQIEYFERDYKVIVTDSRGHGKSGLGTDHLTYVQMMEDYNALLEHLDISPVDLVGWSDGGILGLLLAIHHPDKIHKMALMGANLRPDESAVNSWVWGLLGPMSDTVDEMISSGDTSDNWPLHRQLLDLLKTQPNIPVESIQKIQSPVLVIAGDMDIIRGTHTLEMFDNLPNAHLAILPGQTHWAPATDPDGFNTLVDEFLETEFTRPTSKEILEHELNSAEH